MNTWIITDSHFADEDMFLCGRPLNYEKILVKALKLYCQPEDLLIHLGDVGETGYIFISLPCSKVLIMGNHDKKSYSYYRSKGFDLCCEELVLKDILLTHKPVAKRESIYKNVHGHFHDFPEDRWEAELKAIYDPQWHYLLSLEKSNYLPVNFTKLVAKLKQ